MPEALVVLFVFAISVSAYVSAKIQAGRHTADNDADVARLAHHRQWLEERRQRARNENWDRDMCDRITEEIELAEAQIARREPAAK
jgi:hypothetical protein